jgi:cytochrome P460
VAPRGSALALLVLVVVSARALGADIVLPAEFANYAKWRPLLEKPHAVSLKLWMMCVMPTEAHWETERRRVGPHADRLIMVYGNPVAATGARSGASFPPGAVIAKEKRRSDATSPDGVAFMVKRTDARFKDTGGWEFLYYPTAGDQRATHEQCASCHRKAARDYVFGKYPR